LGGRRKTMSGFNAVLEESELQGGAMRAVAVDGVPVLVSRSEGAEACAIANTCTGFAPKLQATTRRGGLFRIELPLLVSDPDFWCKATCTHRGGPLNEGDRDGDVVTCPWHGSQFDLCSGEVLRGPAREPQQRFEVRAREGKIEVRSP
jgi:nitrite reductase/ring-hydroxylating ferredoxin subunit